MADDGRVTLRRMFALYALYARMDLAWLLRDRTFAVLAILSDMIANAAAIAGILLLAWKFGGIGGMSEHEVLFMLAYTTLVTGIFQTFFSGNNTGHISRRIGRGQLDHMLIQPLPLPVQMLTEGFIPISGSSNLLSGLALMLLALARLNLQPTPLWFAALAGHLLATMAIILGSSYLAASAAFWMPVQAEEISTYVIDTHGSISEFPLSGMPKSVQIALVTIVPSGLLGWFPALSLLGKAPMNLPGHYPALVALILCACASYTFRRGLQYYAKRGVNRYLARGHRR